MNIEEQIRQGRLVCPVTYQRLLISEDRNTIETENKQYRYQLLNGINPILLTDPYLLQKYATSSKRMNMEYAIDHSTKKSYLAVMLSNLVNADYRTRSCRGALSNLFTEVTNEDLCLAIGGGPSRAHTHLTNLNIGLFPNVDVVADAHNLPYADNSVDLIYSEAVFEHLHSPSQAAAEISRVLKPGKKAFICTPFLFPFHGYPSHYQNFTLIGHKHLFENAGLTVIDAGTCVGPIFTLTNIIQTFFKEFFPVFIRLPLRILWGLVSIIIRPLDLLFAQRENAHILASTTYVLVTKP